MDAFDAALADPGAAGLVGQVTRLYGVILGRAPDPSGLRDCIVRLRAGVGLPVLAAGILASAEFIDKPGAAEPRQALCRNALGTRDIARLPSIDPLPDLAAALVRSPEVATRHPVLPALFPDGLSLDDPRAYRIWLAGLASDRVAVPRGHPPSVSILVAVARPASPSLMDTLTSALALDWPGLEVVVASWRFGTAVRRLARQDARIRLLRTPFWHRRARCLGLAAAQCRGGFAAIVAPGDRLNPVDAAPAAFADADIVLSDEDALDADGLRTTPLLGAAWDPDRMLAAGRPGLALIRTALLRRVGFRPGDTDWSVLLRAAAATTPGRIVHVPALLLSRRRPAPCPDPGQVRRHLDATDQPNCRVEAHAGVLRILRPLPEPPPRVSVVVATRDRAELLAACLDGLLHRTDYPDLEVVVIDNGSSASDALAILSRARADPRVRVLGRPGPFNWAALNNDGVRGSTGAVVVLLNNDTEVIEPGWLRELVSQAVRPDVGAVGAKLLYPDHTIQHAGVLLDGKDHALHSWRGMDGEAPGYQHSLVVVRDVVAVTGACLAMRRDVFDAVGGCDAANLPVTWNDVDLCLRVRERGLRVLWTPHARLLHHEQATRGSDATSENDRRFRREQAYMRHRWRETLRIDPFENGLLVRDEGAPRLATRFPAGPGASYQRPFAPTQT